MQPPGGALPGGYVEGGRWTDVTLVIVVLGVVVYILLAVAVGRFCSMTGVWERAVIKTLEEGNRDGDGNGEEDGEERE